MRANNINCSGVFNPSLLTDLDMCRHILDEEAGDGSVEIPVRSLQAMSEHHSNVTQHLLSCALALQLSLSDHVLNTSATNTAPVGLCTFIIFNSGAGIKELTQRVEQGSPLAEDKRMSQ